MDPEFAPEYTTKERIRRIVTAVPLALCFYAISKWWLFPQLSSLARHAECVTVFGIPGVSALFYGTFVGVPITAALVMGALIVPSSWMALRTHRYPPPGTKVYRRTRIKTGWRAVAAASVPLILIAAMVGLGIWGFGPARSMVAGAHSAHPNGWKCAPDEALQPTAKPLRDSPAAVLGR